MIRQDLHVHTTFSDGENTPEEMVLAAIEQGLTRIGFSDHAHTAFDESYCMPLAAYGEYRQTIAALREKYRGQIDVLCGIEQDLYSDASTDGFDYVIGSVHYLRVGQEILPVDESPEILREAVARLFGGDQYALCEAYYAAVAEVADKTGADIIGHFDLITKFNEGGRLFDESHPRYIAAWKAAADRLLTANKPFEINTGAMSRGWRTAPYPAVPVLRYIAARGGRFILSGDSHSRDALCFGFEECERLVETVGGSLAVL